MDFCFGTRLRVHHLEAIENRMYVRAYGIRIGSVWLAFFVQDAAEDIEDAVASKGCR